MRGDFWERAGLVLALIAVAAFILLTPPDLLRKADYLGAVVCHRMPSHSFFIAGHQLPVCQRCTGTFGGALTVILWQWAVWRRRERAFPPPLIWLLMGAMALPWVADGFNSFTALGKGVGVLGYAPQPWLRLLSGALMGTVMGVILVAAFNQTVWADEVASDRAAVARPRDLLILTLASLGVAALVYTRMDWLLYPVTLYLAAAIVALFTLLGTMIWVMVAGREQRYRRWSEVVPAAGWGLVFTALIVASMLAIRLTLTGTIDGMPGL